MADNVEDFDDVDVDVGEDEENLDELELQLKTEDVIRHFEDEHEVYEKMIVTPTPLKTRPILSKYERARMIGIRAQQINSGAKPLVDVGKERDPIKMAFMEADQKIIPMIIRRPIPGKDPNNSASETISPNQILY